MISKNSKIYIAGHRGMVGSACWRALSSEGYTNLIGKTSKELDLKDQTAVENFIRIEKPDAIIDAAARVGGILANHTYPYEFLMDNMLIQNNLIRSAHENDIEKFIFLGSSCIYPLDAANPINENSFMGGKLEATNSPYAMAKLSSIEIGRALSIQFGHKVINLMPTNLYGPKDNFSKSDSHVIPGIIARMNEAMINNELEFQIWGTGKPLREFLYVDDLASAIKFIIENDVESDLINIGSGEEVTVHELALLIKEILNYKGNLIFDDSKPDGNPRKLLDSSLINSYGWNAKTDLKTGLELTYNWFLKNK